MRYDKLVRDKIPEIIRSKGTEPVVHVAGEAEYREKLRAKLSEEVSEYLESGSWEELADILEVVHALGALDGATPADLEAFRSTKAADRGAFRERVILEEA